MGVRKKPRDKTVRIELGNTSSDDAADTPSVDGDDVEAALSALPEGSVAKIYKIEEDGSMPFVAQLAPSAVSEERIARAGPGEYLIRFIGPLGDGTNRRGYRGQRRIRIHKGVTALADTSMPPPAPSAPSSSPSPSSALDLTIVTVITNLISQQAELQRLAAEQQREHSAMVMTALGNMNKPQERDPVLGVILTSLLEKRVDPIDQAARLLEVTGVNKAAPHTPVTELAALLDLSERLRGLTGSDGPPGARSWMDYLAPMVPALLSQARTADQHGGVGSSVPPASPAAGGPERSSAPAGVPPLPPPPPSPVLSPLAFMLREHVPRLVEAAEARMDPAAVAHAFVAGISPSLHDGVASVLDGPTVLTELLASFPELRSHALWTEAVRIAILDVLDGDDADAEGEEDAGGGGGVHGTVSGVLGHAAPVHDPPHHP